MKKQCSEVANDASVQLLHLNCKKNSRRSCFVAALKAWPHPGNSCCTCNKTIIASASSGRLLFFFPGMWLLLLHPLPDTVRQVIAFDQRKPWSQPQNDTFALCGTLKIELHCSYIMNFSTLIIVVQRREIPTLRPGIEVAVVGFQKTERVPALTPLFFFLMHGPFSGSKTFGAEQRNKKKNGVDGSGDVRLYCEKSSCFFVYFL